MYSIECSDGTVLYDTSDPTGNLLTEPRCSREIGQAGSLSFQMLPIHPAYDDVQAFKTYISAYQDGEEIFYGRVIDVETSQITGIKQVQCAGALQFLEDGELSPISNENLTRIQFIERCLECYNADIDDDPDRMLYLGTVNVPGAQILKGFNITSYTKVKTALETQLLNEDGGFLRISVDYETGRHQLDWLEDFGELNDSPIELTENVISQDNAETGADFFTALRPVGANGLTLPEMYIALDDDLLEEYGQIVNTVTFNAADTEAKLREAAENYISKLGKGLGRTGTIKMVDMHFLDPEESTIRMGAVYNNIAGFVGEDLVVAAIEQSFDNPADDSVTLKNKRELMSSSRPSSVGTGAGLSGRGTMSGSGGAKAFQNIYNHIHESETKLEIQADEIALHARDIQLTMQNLESFSTQTMEDIDSIRGTGIFQNSDHLTQLAGVYTIRYRVVPDSKMYRKVTPLPADNPKTKGWYEYTGGAYVKTEDTTVNPSKTYYDGANPSFAGWYEWHDNYVIQQSDINSGKELYENNTDAQIGNAIPTAKFGQPREDDPSRNWPSVGEMVGQMVKTAHTTIYPGATYYTRSYGIENGTELYLDEEGVEFNALESIKAVTEEIQAVEGSSLWVNKDHIVAATGELEIHIDPNPPHTRSLIIKSGGGLYIERDGAQFGVYDNGNLTAGVIATTVNGTPSTYINGNYIQVGSGSTAKILTTALNDIVDNIGAANISFTQMDEPEGTEERPLRDGDIWFKTNGQRTWQDAMDMTTSWASDSGLLWQDLRGSVVKTYDEQAGEWKDVLDERVLAQDSTVRVLKDSVTTTVRELSTDFEGKLQAAEGRFEVTARQISATVMERYNGLDNAFSSALTQTAREIRAEVTDSVNGLSATLSVTAGEIRGEVADSVSELQGSISVQAARIGLVVEGTGSNAHIKPASIVAAINDDQTSTVTISASKIALDGNTTLSGAMHISSGSLVVDRALMIGTNISTMVSVNNGKITADTLQTDTVTFINPGQGGGYYNIGYDQIKDMIIKADVDGNTLRLWKRGDSPSGTPTITFRKATSLSGEWSGNTLTVTADTDISPYIVSPFVQPVTSQGAVYADFYLATGKSAAPGYDTHGSATRAYLVKNGRNVQLKSEDSTVSGIVYAVISAQSIYDDGFDAQRNVYLTDGEGSYYVTTSIQSGTTRNYYPGIQKSDGTWMYGSAVSISAYGGGSGGSISLGDFQWLSQSEYEAIQGTTDPRADAEPLSTLKSLLSSHWSTRGYAMFKATSGGTNDRWYRIATG